MIYPKNSFYTNFVGAYKSKDNEIKKDLIFSQIGQLIAKKKKDVIAMFKEVGVNLPKKPTENDIVNSIVKNHTNRRLHIGLAYLIHENNKKEFEQFSNQTGNAGWLQTLAGTNNTTSSADETGAGATTTSTAASAGGSTIGAIANTITSIFTYATTSKEVKAQQDADRASMIAATSGYKTGQATSGTGNGKKKSNLGWWIFGAVLLVGGIGAYFYFSRKGKGGIEVKEAGGGLNSNINTSTSTNTAAPVSIGANTNTGTASTGTQNIVANG